jgi:hypothetical protein
VRATFSPVHVKRVLTPVEVVPVRIQRVNNRQTPCCDMCHACMFWLKTVKIPQYFSCRQTRLTERQTDKINTHTRQKHNLQCLFLFRALKIPRQGKARQGKARQGKARQGKARQGKARQGKARQGKARHLGVILVKRISF